ncbi:hypothetical protein P9112_008796 [Eukaryota sp. TZLM1-RC]
MSSSHNIEVYARIRPYVSTPERKFKVHPEDNSIVFHVPKDSTGGLINNTRENWTYSFTKVFDEPTQQDEVFEVIGRKMITSLLEGYNATTFAYGQTSSGKTHTLTGPPDVSGDFESRGLIPRSLATVFEEIEKRPDRQFTIALSYLELYNEKGYDLLNPDRHSHQLEDLPKVSIMEDQNGNVTIPGLTKRVVSSLDEALDILWEGDTVRVIASTPMNDASTRSHCVFSIYVTSKAADSNLIRESKLNLVDLAGSERVGSTGVDGRLLREATGINLSLFYLEQVITALSEKKQGRSHIPYRNSILTSVLRDSLGGNCRTIMIATLAANPVHSFESMSTCQFAQRVGQIKNVSRINDSLDLQSIVKQLRRENLKLKQEIALLRSDGERGPITESEKVQLVEQVKEYIESREGELFLTDFVKIQAAFEIFKELVNSKSSGLGNNDVTNEEEISGDQVKNSRDQDTVDDTGRIHSLQELLSQRDFEIEVLVDQNRKNEELISIYKQNFGEIGHEGSSNQAEFAQSTPETIDQSPLDLQSSPAVNNSHSPQATSQQEPLADPITSSGLRYSEMVSVIEDKASASEFFRKSYYLNDSIEKDKQNLADLYSQAKSIGKTAKEVKAEVEVLKKELNSIRAALVGDNSPDLITKEAEISQLIAEKKDLYKQLLEETKVFKSRITEAHTYMERVKEKMTSDFKIWLSAQTELLSSMDVNYVEHSPRPKSSRSSRLSSRPKSKSTVYTGDPTVDREIEKFYKTKRRVLDSIG